MTDQEEAVVARGPLFDAADITFPPITMDEPIFMRLYSGDGPVATWTPEDGWTRPPWHGPDDVL